MAIIYHHICLKTKNRLFLLKLPFREQNKLKSKNFIKKFHNFRNDNFILAISCKRKKNKIFI